MEAEASHFGYIDFTIIAVVVLLGFKGIWNGLIKEFFGFVGLILGIYLASRYYVEFGSSFGMESTSLQSLIAFIIILAAVWIGSILVGLFLTKVVNLAALESADKTAGFIFGALKGFLILSLLFYGISNVGFLSGVDSSIKNNSKMHNFMSKIGSGIMNTKVVRGITDEVSSTSSSAIEEAKGGIDAVSSEVKKQVIDGAAEGIKNEIVDSLTGDKK